MDNPIIVDVKTYVDDPDSLINLCESVLNIQLSSLNNSELTEKQAQLIEITRSVTQLEKLAITIPDELRELKISLLTDVENQNRNKGKLEHLLLELEKVTNAAKVAYEREFPKKQRTRKRRQRSDAPHTKQDVFRQEIIDALKVLGGSGTIKDVLKIIEERMKDKLQPGDFKTTSRGEPLWKNNAHWARNSLREDGILRGDSPRGIWELSEDYK